MAEVKASNRRVLRSKNLQESSIAIDSEAVETVVSEADKIAARLAARVKTTKTPKRQKKNKKKNPVPEQVNNEKISETHDKPDDSNDITDEAALATLGNTSSSTTVSQSIDTGMENKICQLITPDDSYWKNLTSRICKTQLPLLGLYPDELEFKKCFEVILKQEKPGYIKQYGFQWCREVIKSRRCDKAKDVQAAMFDIFGEQNLSRINTSAKADDIQAFKNSNKTKEAFKCLFEMDDDNILPYIEAIKKKAWGKKSITKRDTAFTLAVCEIMLNLRHPKISVGDDTLRNRFNMYWVKITADTTKPIRQVEFGKDYVSSEDSDSLSDSFEEDLDNRLKEHQKRYYENDSDTENQSQKHQQMDNDVPFTLSVNQKE
ncbi:18988_t:CDS:2 [Rhizophagus irregularis]|nr:18988_t:CDS:2 [Rhizophagus irregularis]